jgi:hypothetical protein
MKPKELLKIDKEQLLQYVVDILKKAERPLEGSEIARRILVEKVGEDWWKVDGSHDVFRRLGRRIIQLLCLAEHGRRNRKRLGIDFDVSNLGNHPLRFFLEK